MDDYEINEEEQNEASIVPYEPSPLSRAIDHPRVLLGGGSLLISLAVDFAASFDPTIIVLGVVASVAIGWNGEALVNALLDQRQVRDDTDQFADQFLGDHPIYADQSIGGKLRRLIKGSGDEAIITSPLKSERIISAPREISPATNEQGLTFDRIVAWFDQGRINDTQFFALLQRIDDPDSRRNGYGNVASNGREAATEAAVSTQMEPLRPQGWNDEKIQQLTGAFLATNHLDNSLKAIALSTSQRNRDFARETLKQQGLWKDNK